MTLIGHVICEAWRQAPTGLRPIFSLFFEADLEFFQAHKFLKLANPFKPIQTRFKSLQAYSSQYQIVNSH